MKSPPLIAFLVASAGIHAGVVLTSNNAMTITLPGSTGSDLAIRVIETSPQNKEHIPIKKTPVNVAKPLIKSETQAKDVKTEARKKAGKPALASHSAKKTQAHVVSVLIKEFNQYFTYPKLAIKRNWQGKVLLSLRITSSGKIKNIYVNRGSGYSVLDDAAVNSMRQIETLPRISSLLDTDIELQLPVIYKLTEG